MVLQLINIEVPITSDCTDRKKQCALRVHEGTAIGEEMLNEDFTTNCTSVSVYLFCNSL